MKNLIVPTITLRTALRIRPLLLDLLQRRGISPWNHLDKRLEFIFQAYEVDGGRFLTELEETEIPAGDSDWEGLPLYFLCDFLTDNHRQFMLHDIPEISHILDIHSIPTSSENRDLLEIQSDFKAIVQEFMVLIQGEEDFLFPKILRNEACLIDSEVHPEFHRGSVHVYLATKNSNPILASEGPLAKLREKALQHLAQDPQSFYGHNLLELLQAFQTRLSAHGRLEQEILYVRARNTEKELYNRSIRGEARSNFNRDPRDSGILRLSLS